MVADQAGPVMEELVGVLTDMAFLKELNTMVAKVDVVTQVIIQDMDTSSNGTVTLVTLTSVWIVALNGEQLISLKFHRLIKCLNTSSYGPKIRKRTITKCLYS